MKPVLEPSIEPAADHPESGPSGPHGPTATPLGRVAMCGSRDGLAAINEPGTELAIWRRALPADLREWIARTPAAALPEIRILVRPRDLRPALEPLLDASGMAAGAMRTLLVEDIGELVGAFAELTRSDCVDVRLERIEHDACWKFHRDTVEMRLVTTYRGPTTEWVPMSHAQRALDEQTAYAGPLERLCHHDVAVFKGNLAGQCGGVMHRSPPIEGTGVSRLFLCLNTASIVSPDVWIGR
jgi:hypothetical protein